MTGRGGWRGTLATASLLLLGTPGCFTPRKAVPPGAIVTPVGTFILQLDVWDEGLFEMLQGAVPEAAGALERWGHLEQPVRIRVVFSHSDLEDAAGRRLPGLSAWARRTEVLVENPRHWPLPPGPDDLMVTQQIRRTEVTALLKHELTHSLMFQLAGLPPSDPGKRIPFWFKEGMATVTADEFTQWPPLLKLAQWLKAHPGVDLLRDAEQIARTDNEVAYGAALHGFNFFVRRYGDAAVVKTLRMMRTTDRFVDAFQEAGIGLDAFRSDFDRYLRWRGFVPSRPMKHAGQDGGAVRRAE